MSTPTHVERAEAMQAAGFDPWAYIVGYLTGSKVPGLVAEIEKAMVSAERYAATIVEHRQEPQECGAKAWEVPGADPCTRSWIPCQERLGHLGQHYSTSGCAGPQVTW